MDTGLLHLDFHPRGRRDRPPVVFAVVIERELLLLQEPGMQPHPAAQARRPGHRYLIDVDHQGVVVSA
jgi:hypothetical protein